MKYIKYFSVVIVLALVLEWGFPHLTLAAEFVDLATTDDVSSVATQLSGVPMAHRERFPIPFLRKPGSGYATEIPKVIAAAKRKELPRSHGYVVATAYSSTPDQTDSDPCTTANGYNVCKKNQENVIAANFLSFGTKVTFPEVYGNRVFVVQDRMHPRFTNRVDIWMKTRASAKQWGVRRVKMEILPDQIATNIR